jgi:hypothetical protein
MKLVYVLEALTRRCRSAGEEERLCLLESERNGAQRRGERNTRASQAIREATHLSAVIDVSWERLFVVSNI